MRGWACFFAVAALLFSTAARAQDEPGRQADAVLQDIADIDAAVLLSTIKLSAEQLKRLVPGLKAIQADHNARVAKAANAAMQMIAADVKAARRAALAGTPPGKSLMDRAKKAADDFKKVREREDNTTLGRLSSEFRKVVTPEQIALGAKWGRAQFKSSEGDDVQFFNVWILKAVMGSPRSMALLEEMQSALAASP
jgi:hypothetical protein